MKVLQIFESDEFKKFRAKRELRVHKGKLVMTNKNMMVMTMVVMRVDAGSGHHDHRGQPQGDRHGHLRLRHPGKERCLPCESSFFCLSHTLSTGWLGLESRFQSQPK